MTTTTTRDLTAERVPSHVNSALVLGNEDDLAQMIPYLLGFAPEDSIVVLLLEDQEIVFTVRVDLNLVEQPGYAEDFMTRLWAQHPDVDAQLVAYTNQVDHGWMALNRCRAAMPVKVACHEMVVVGDSWHGAGGANGQISWGGTVAAEATYQGRRRLPGRSELVASFASAAESDDLKQQMVQGLRAMPDADDIEGKRAAITKLLSGYLGKADGLSVFDATQLAMLVLSPDAREVALLSITAENAADQLVLWRKVVNLLPKFVSELPLYLAGMAAWVMGEGATASVAYELSTAGVALDEDDTDLHAELLGGIIDQVVPPDAWGKYRETVLSGTTVETRAAVAKVLLGAA